MSEPKYKIFLQGANSLSLGISIVVAILLGVGIGILLKNYFEEPLLLWLGVIWGVGGAGSNVYKAYKKQMKEMNDLAQEYKERRGDK
jgi:F0F1-type ATP synthase assembly protein I